MYNDIEMEPYAQVPMERVRLSDDSSDRYQDSHGSDQSKSDTEPDMEANDILDATGAGLRHQSPTADGQTNNGVSTVRVLITSGSQEATLVGRTPAARGRVVASSGYTPPVPCHPV